MKFVSVFIRVIVPTVLFLSASAAVAQFTDPQAQPPVSIAPPKQGGPIAIGQMQAQRDDSGKVSIIQAPAVAAPATSGGIIQLSAFGWLEPYVDTVVQALIVAFFGWIGKSKYSQWLDQSGRDALQTFLQNRASSLIADGAVRLQGKAVHVDNNMLYRAASEATTAIPDALKRFKLTPDVVAAKIIDAIPQTTAGAAIVAAAHIDDVNGAAPVPVTDRPSSAPEVAAPNQMPPTSAS